MWQVNDHCNVMSDGNVVNLALPKVCVSVSTHEHTDTRFCIQSLLIFPNKNVFSLFFSSNYLFKFHGSTVLFLPYSQWYWSWPVCNVCHMSRLSFQLVLAPICDVFLCQLMHVSGSWHSSASTGFNLHSYVLHVSADMHVWLAPRCSVLHFHVLADAHV
jgi:hypothetical protein